MKILFRAKLLSIHRWLGLSIGIYFALMALSGSYLIYDDVLEVWLNPERYIAEGETSDFNVPRLVTVAQEAIGTSYLPNRIQIPEGKDRNVVMTFLLPQDKGKPLRKVVYVDPFSYRFKDAHAFRENFAGSVFRFHQELLLGGDTGRPLVASGGILFFLLLGSGLTLWWPKRQHVLRSLSWPRLRAFYPGTFELHKLIGIYALPLLLLLVVTGVYLAKPDWFEARKEAKGPEAKPVFLANGGPLDFAAFAALLTEKSIALRPLSLSLDAKKMEIDIRIPTTQAQFRYEIDTANLQDVKATNESRPLKRLLHDLHAGHFWGWGGEILIFLAMPVVLFLTGSGFYLWWKRPSRKRFGKGKSVA